VGEPKLAGKNASISVVGKAISLSTMASTLSSGNPAEDSNFRLNRSRIFFASTASWLNSFSPPWSPPSCSSESSELLRVSLLWPV